jgi:hypothetical protein
MQQRYPECTLQYTNVNGLETVTLIPGPPPEPSGRREKGRWLILEVLWDDDGVNESQPYVYSSGGVPWDYAFVNVPGVAIGDSVTCFGTSCINGIRNYIPGLPAALGKAGAYEGIYHSTADPFYYELLGALPIICGTVTGASSITLIDDANIYGFPFEWSGTADSSTGTTRFRYKGVKGLHPHELFIRVNQVDGEHDGVGVGVNPEESIYGEPPWDGQIYDAVDEMLLYYRFPVAKTTTLTVPENPLQQIQTVVVDLRKYEKEVGPVTKLRCSGFWRSASTAIHPINDGPDDGFIPQQFFADEAEYSAYVFDRKMGQDTTAWADVQEDIPPHPAEIRATILRGPENIQDYIDREDVVRGEITKVICTKTISASQPVTNVRSAPDVLPWGDIFGTVKCDIYQSSLRFLADE